MSNVELKDILNEIQVALEKGFDLEIKISNNTEFKNLPTEKLYTAEDFKNMDYVQFITNIYIQLEKLEKEQSYRFSAHKYRCSKDNPESGFYFPIRAVSPFDVEVKENRMVCLLDIFLLNKKYFLKKVEDAVLPQQYKDILFKEIYTCGEMDLTCFQDVLELGSSELYSRIVKPLMEEYREGLEEQRISLEQFKNRLLKRLKILKYPVEDYKIEIDGEYIHFSNKFFGKIFSIRQWKKVDIQYHLDFE